MPESAFSDAVQRPTMCPSCNGKRIDTLAKVLTVSTLWRCRVCESTWTIASLKNTFPRSRA